MFTKKQKPVTLITGYLGAGKTTVMNELLKNQDGKKIAVIVNDMGSVNIDAELLKSSAISSYNTKMIELQNGCICCTLRDEFMQQIEELSTENDIEAVLVEASGISNPASIADAFLMYEETHRKSSIFLNSVVTVVDADRIYSEFLADIEALQANQQDESEEDESEDDPDIINLVMDQIEFCNVILLNKCDLLTEDQLKQVKIVLKELQPEAELIETIHGQVDADVILNKKRFDYDKVSNSSMIAKALAHEHEKNNEMNEDGNHEEYGISSFVYEERRPFDYNSFMSFVEKKYPESLIRAKGYVWFQDDDIHAHLFEQAGRNASVSECSNWVAALPKKDQEEVFENYPDVKDDWDEQYGDRLNQIVFIGKGYDKEKIITELNNCLYHNKNLY